MHIYIAGPYTNGNPLHNVHVAIAAATELVRLGHEPYVPHLSHYWNEVTPQTYQYWIDRSMAWLPKCDALLRIPGDSPGADLEEREAVRLGLPVYHTLLDVPAADGTS